MVSPRVWVGSQPCGFAQSIFDTLLKSSASAGAASQPRDHHADRTVVSIQEEPNGVVSLSLSSEDSTSLCIPMGRARECSWMDSSPCPTTLVDPSKLSPIPHPDTRRHPFVRLAVVGLILDPTCQHILITRRPSYMRSFPGAWVFPGGTIHPQESLSQAIQREVLEETGLNTTTSHWKMECLWESVYPTIFPANMLGSSKDKLFLSPDQIQAHHLVLFLSTILSESSPLKLCPEEVDGAVWLSRDHVSQILHHRRTEQQHQQQYQPVKSPVPQQLVLHSAAKENGSDQDLVPLHHLLGIYPQSITICKDDDDIGQPTPTTMLGGMAQGSLFALEEFYKTQIWNRDPTRH